MILNCSEVMMLGGAGRGGEQLLGQRVVAWCTSEPLGAGVEQWTGGMLRGLEGVGGAVVQLLFGRSPPSIGQSLVRRGYPGIGLYSPLLLLFTE